MFIIPIIMNYKKFLCRKCQKSVSLFLYRLIDDYEEIIKLTSLNREIRRL